MYVCCGIMYFDIWPTAFDTLPIKKMQNFWPYILPMHSDGLPIYYHYSL